MLYTLGYEQRDIDEMLALLVRHAVEVLVDVRGTPRSRKPGFSKTRLSKVLAECGIDYRHEAALGVPRDERDAFRAGEAPSLERYRRRLRTEARSELEQLAELVRSRSVALLCFERDESSCHRRLVAEALLAQDPRVEHVPLV